MASEKPEGGTESAAENPENRLFPTGNSGLYHYTTGNALGLGAGSGVRYSDLSANSQNLVAAGYPGYPYYYGVNRVGYAEPSGWGGGGYDDRVTYVSGYGPSRCSDDGLNPFLVLITLAGAAVGFYFIYNKLTMITGRKTGDFFDNLVGDVIWAGT